MVEYGKVKIEKFEGHDFGFERMLIGDSLYLKKLHEPLSEKKSETIKKD